MSSDIYTAPRSENLLKLSQGLALRHLSKIVASKQNLPSAEKGYCRPHMIFVSLACSHVYCMVLAVHICTYAAEERRNSTRSASHGPRTLLGE